MIVGVPTEVKDNEYRVAATPEGRARAGACRALGGRPVGGRRRLGAARRRLHVRGRRGPAGRRRGLRRRGHDPQGEGAAAAGVRALPRGADPVHVPPSGGRRGADAVPGGALGRGGGVRDRAAARRPPAAAGADVRDRRPDGSALRGEQPGAAQGRARGADRRCLGGRARARGRPRRGHGRDERGVDRGRHGGRGHDRRQERRAAAVRRSDLARPDPDGDVQPARRRAAGDVGRPGDRGRAGSRCEGAAAGDRGHGGAHAARSRRRGHLDRPGWLLRDVAHDDALGPDVRGARRGPLLRGEHAGRGPAHLDVRAHQRDDPVRDRDREPRSGGRDPPRSRARVWG